MTESAGMPTDRATARAAPSLSPDSMIVRRSSPCSADTASAEVARGGSPNARRPSTRVRPVSRSASHETVWPRASRASASSARAPGSPAISAIRPRWPINISRPSTVAVTPRPARAPALRASGTASSRARAASTTAVASGCRLPDSTAAASLSSSSSVMPDGRMATSVGLPTVRVPVLSSATTRTRCAASSASASLTRMPARAATPVPAMMAVGVARPRAQGQEITSTATAFRVATLQSPAHRPQPRKVTAAIAITTGTNTALTRSTMRWIGALRAWASSTSRMIRASAVSAPTAVVRNTRRPSPFTAPPVACPPGTFGTGRDSPVSSDSSTWLRPSTISPSTGMRSPGSTTTRSPTRTSAIATSTSRPPRRTRATLGRRACSARMASVVWRFARASSHLPSSTSAITTAEASKYRCPPCADSPESRW